MKTDAAFIQDLKESQKAVFKVAEYLNQKRFTVEIPALNIRPDRSCRMQYVDDYDLLIKRNGKEYRCEVKQHRNGWKENGQYKYPAIILENAHKIEKAGFVDWYFITNDKLTRLAFASAEKIKEYGFTKEMYNKAEGKSRLVWMLPTNKMEFRDI